MISVCSGMFIMTIFEGVTTYNVELVCLIHIWQGRVTFSFPFEPVHEISNNVGF